MRKRLIFTILVKRHNLPETSYAFSPVKFLDEDTFGCTSRAMERYARRVNADYLVVRDVKYSLILEAHCRQEMPTGEKLRIADFLKDYERVLYLDGDVLITPEADDIFARFPDPGFLYAYDEGCEERDRVVKNLMDGFALRDWPRNEKGSYRYFNSGVMLASRPQRTALEDIELDIAARIYRMSTFADQDYLNYLVHTRRIPWRSLPSEFNRIDVFTPEHKDRFSASFIHYAGSGFVFNPAGRPTLELLHLRSVKIVCDYASMYIRVKVCALFRISLWVADKTRRVRSFLGRRFYSKKNTGLSRSYRLQRNQSKGRVSSIMKKFNRQQVPGSLFGVGGQMRLPLFAGIQEKDSYKGTGIDLLAGGEEGVWLVKVVLGPPDGAHCEELHQKWSWAPGTRCWLVTMGISSDVRKVAQRLGIMFSSGREIEELESLLEQSPEPP